MAKRKRCHVCLEDVVSFTNNKQCCNAFICNECLKQCMENDIVKCPICKSEFDEENIQFVSQPKINICNSSLQHCVLSYIVITILLFIAFVVIFVILYHEDYDINDIILHAFIISLIGIMSFICGCIIALKCCRT